MDLAVYAIESRAEATHWWFVGRRRLFAREIARLGLAREARILDVGAGTGSNLRLLAGLGFKRVQSVDQSDEAIRFCAEKGLGAVAKGDASALPFPDGRFDLVIASDVIEHIDDDRRALREFARVLAPGGRLLLTVPAFQALWGLQDEVSHHRRRYRLRPLLGLIAAAGLTPRRHYYFNYLLFTPIWLARRLIDLLAVPLASEARLNNPIINRLLTAIFRLDVASAPWLKPPFGVSALAVAAKPNPSAISSRIE
jgi:SAM-dependent methyltransferase